MLKIQSFTFNPYQENTYILYDESKEGIIVDPGNYEKHENKLISSFIEKHSLKIAKIIMTHCHIDHVLGNRFLFEKYGAEIFITFIEKDMYSNMKNFAPVFGFTNYSHQSEHHYLSEFDKIKFGNIELEVLLLPGHSPGHLAFINKQENICVSGDVLFLNSIGRTDLPGGDFNTLIDSIKNKLFLLDENTIIYPGHGPETILKNEIMNNPFLI